MEFTKKQKGIIENAFNAGKYQIVYKSVSKYKTAWSIIVYPTWDWENYEYRMLAYVDHPMSDYDLDDLYVYTYNQNLVYYNEPSKVTRVYNLNGRDADGSLTTTAALESDFNVPSGNVIIGDRIGLNTQLTVLGKTSISSTSTAFIGPNIMFSTESGKTGDYVKVGYTDQDIIDATVNDPTPIPTITLWSKGKNEVVILHNAKLVEHDSSNINTTDYRANETLNADVLNTNELEIIPEEVGRIWYPVGSYYWSSVDINPSKYFGGEWAKITNAFLYGSSMPDDADGVATTYVRGTYEETINTNTYPTHTHSIENSGHSHSYTVSVHNHFVMEHGHSHMIVTFGDDYNGRVRNYSNGKNFAGDGVNDMTETNYRRGIYAITQFPTSYESTCWPGQGTSGGTDRLFVYPGCTFPNGDSYINKAINNYEIMDHIGGGKPHNNMPPYIKAYCWHRIK